MDTEGWVLKGTKLITNTKKQRLKIYSRYWIFKNTILKKRKKVTKIIRNIYEVCFKKWSFFGKVIVGYKRIKEVLKKRMIVKIYLGVSLVLWAV